MSIRKQFTFLDEGKITKEVEEKGKKNLKDRYKNIYKNINFAYCFIIIGENKVLSDNQNYS